MRTRLDEVCRTIYLAFTAGYSPGTGADLLRIDIAGEAVRLVELLHQVAPDASQIKALWALVTLQHARRDARAVDGRLVTLANQDRSRWHHEETRTALDLLATLGPGSGYYEELRLQAFAAAEHARSPSAEATDWHAIAGIYSRLELLTRSPVVRLNRAVAVAEATSAEHGLELLDGLDELLPGSHRLAAIRAELYQRSGDKVAARNHFEVARDRCANDAERAFLSQQIAALD